MTRRQLDLLATALALVRANPRYLNAWAHEHGLAEPVTDDEIDALQLLVANLPASDGPNDLVDRLNEATRHLRSDGVYKEATVLAKVPVVGLCEHVIPSAHADLFLLDPRTREAELVMTYYPAPKEGGCTSS